MALPVSRTSAVVGGLVSAVMAVGLQQFLEAPLWLVVAGSALNAAFYVAVVEIVLSRIRQAELAQFERELE